MRLSHRRHAAFYLAAIAGLAAALAAGWFLPRFTVMAGANAFFAVYLAMTFRSLSTLTPAVLRRHAETADEPVWIIFLVTLGTAVVAIVSLFLLINGKQEPGLLAFALAASSVFLGWFTIHMMAGMHYAHLYWQPREAGADSERGLDFPGKEEPGGTDFLYFSYILGMTAQTADVDITSRAMRSAALVHAIVSFFFNTVLVAAAVNAAVALGQ